MMTLSDVLHKHKTRQVLAQNSEKKYPDQGGSNRKWKKLHHAKIYLVLLLW
jgi:hypothetical protein